MGFIEEQEKLQLEIQAKIKRQEEAEIIAKEKKKIEHENIRAQVRADFVLWREQLLAALEVLGPGIDMAQVVIETYIERLRRTANQNDILELKSGKFLLKSCIVQRLDEMWPIGELYKSIHLKHSYSSNYISEEVVITQEAVNGIVSELPINAQIVRLPTLVLQNGPFLKIFDPMIDPDKVYCLTISPNPNPIKSFGYSVKWHELSAYYVGYDLEGNTKQLKPVTYRPRYGSFSEIDFVLMSPQQALEIERRMKESTKRAYANPHTSGIDRFHFSLPLSHWHFISKPGIEYDGYPYFGRDDVHEKYLSQNELTAQNLESMVEIVFKGGFFTPFNKLFEQPKQPQETLPVPPKVNSKLTLAMGVFGLFVVLLVVVFLLFFSKFI